MKILSLHSEEDIRTKLIVPWLVSQGFLMDDISIEFSFRIKLGRSIVIAENGNTHKSSIDNSASRKPQSTYMPRADILVRNSEGHNLLIFEVKAPAESLDDDARDQGISYARCLLEGNIAPFVVLTNGADTRIFDTYSRQEINGNFVPLGPACKERTVLKLGVDDLALRAEALETLISFSTSNLVAFCKAQSSFRMRSLFSNDTDSDRKFIPSLYIDRAKAKNHFNRLLDEESRRVVLLIGHPQVGKTNFVCKTVLDRLALGQPCLFFPAVSINQSLLEAIAHDFEWTFVSSTGTYSQLIRRIVNVLRRANTRLTIFIDGWNETNIQLARTIDEECSRLSNDHIQIVISLTHSTAVRLLKGATGSPTFLADEAGLPVQGPELITLDPEAAAQRNGWSCVHIQKYSADEQNLAYTTYKKIYSVSEPANHIRSSDPYVIGVAMRQYQRHSLPEMLDEPALLLNLMKRKMERAIGLEELNVPFCLRELAQTMLTKGAPIPMAELARIWGLPAARNIPDGFFDAALLARETDELGIPSVDFYYGRERDYAIACLAGEWVKKLTNKIDLNDDFNRAVLTSPGRDAVRWFLKQASHIYLLKIEGSKFPHFAEVSVRRIFFSALCDHISLKEHADEDLVHFALSTALNDSDRNVRIEAVKLTVLAVDDADEIVTILNKESSLEDFVEAVLAIGEEFPLQAESAGQVALDALRQLHLNSTTPDDGGSDITEILNVLCGHSHHHVRREANTCFGHISPFAYVEYLANEISTGRLNVTPENADELIEGLALAEDGLADSYYGDLCPGAIDAICEEPESQANEYHKMSKILEPIIHAFDGLTTTTTLEEILKDLHINIENYDEDWNLIETTEPVIKYVDTYTLPLPFFD